MGFVGVAAVTTNPLLAGRAHAAAAAGRQRAEPDRCRPGRAVRPTGGIGCYTSWPLPSAVLVDHARAPCLHRAAMIGIADPVRAETALAAGTLACPGCARPLRPWGHARSRTVRDHGTTRLALRPRRARCRACRVTHVLLPTAATLRRADSTAVIGSALLASARGAGFRRIAAELDRPLSTVRRWVRAVRDPGHVEWLRTQGMVWLSRVDLDVINTLVPQPTRLGDALTALAAAALTLRARVLPHLSPWPLVGQLTHGRLVGPPVPARPG